ncbi:MAG: hypothetical protein ACPGJV_01635 [Bacteriovoracaceae bacterium]
MKQVLLLTSLLFSSALLASKNSRLGYFSGRVSKVNQEAGLVRLKVEFGNQRYLNINDEVEFLRHSTNEKSCKGYIKGRTADYILVRIPSYRRCRDLLYLGNGAYIRLYSDDLANNLRMGKELMRILVKKHMALTAKERRIKKQLEQHIEKINAVNKRYQVLREKLENEWRSEIQSLEEDQSIVLNEYKEIRMQKDELNQKLEVYKLESTNLVEDRWALDPSHYFRK